MPWSHTQSSHSMECICQCTIACNSNNIKVLIKHRILSVETVLYQATHREFSQTMLQPQQQCLPRQNCTATQCYNHNNNAHRDRTVLPRNATTTTMLTETELYSHAMLQPQQQCSPRQNCTATQCYNNNNNAHRDRTVQPRNATTTTTTLTKTELNTKSITEVTWNSNKIHETTKNSLSYCGCQKLGQCKCLCIL